MDDVYEGSAPRQPRAPSGREAPDRSGAPRDARVETVRVVAELMDDAIPIPGTSLRIGLDPILGLIPGIGDVLGAAVSTWILVAASRLGAPPSVLARMGVNVAVDAVFGLLPFAGDLFDVGWKANRRNARLLEGWLDQPVRTRRSSRAIVAAIVIATAVAVAAILYAGWRIVAFAWDRLSAA
jgi:hypothetical protein